MWSIKEIKARGRAAFKANYWACVIVGFLLIALIGGTSLVGSRLNIKINEPAEVTSIELQDTDVELDPELEEAIQELETAINELPESDQVVVASAILGILVIAAIVGFLLKIFLFNPLQVGCYRFFRKNAEDPSVSVGVIGEGFGGFGHVFFTLLLRDIFIVLWSILLVIPGIVKSYAYAFVPYIIKDNPELSAGQVIRLSKDMTRGNKGQMFLLDLSFLGWILLGIVTFNLVNVFWTMPYYESTKATLYLRLSNQDHLSPYNY